MEMYESAPGSERETLQSVVLCIAYLRKLKVPNEEKATARKYGYCYEDDKLTPTALAGSCARSCGLCADD
eukprot:scaffold10197_cov270-Chaetoceros_neogracile.AAC.22